MRRSWLLAIGLVLSCTLPAVGAPDIGDGAAAATAAAVRAEERFQAADYEGALAAYRAAIDARIGALEDEERAQVQAIRGFRSLANTDPAAYVARVDALLAPYDRLEQEIARYEFGVARALAHLKRPAEAARAVGRALGGDLGLLAQIRKSADLKSIRKCYEYEGIMLRIEHGQGRLITDDPLIEAVGRRDFRRCLKCAPATVELYRRTPLVGYLRGVAIKREDAQAPARLTLKSYTRLVRLGILLPRTHRGWAYRHSHLFDGGPSIEALADQAYAKFTETEAQPAGSFWALVAFFPALHLGNQKRMQQLLAYLEKQSSIRHEDAVDGMYWLLDAYAKEGAGLPGMTPAETTTLRDKTLKKAWELRNQKTFLRAWSGRRDSMSTLGYYYLRERFGKENQARCFAWSNVAYRLGDKNAALDLGNAYRGGFGVEKDLEQGFELCLEAAEGGDPEGMNVVGYAYQYGEGTDQDYEAAIEWFQKAAAKGHANAAESLGQLLHRGLGTEQDYDGAREAYEQARKAGHERAHRRLGNLALDARRGSDDLAQAEKHLRASLEALPTDMITVIYLWTALQLQGKAKEARSMVRRARSKGPLKGLHGQLALFMTHSTIRPERFLPKLEKEKDEAQRASLHCWIHFVAGVQCLAKGKPVLAKPHFEECVKVGQIIDSIRHSAQAELKRLASSEG